MSPPRAHRRSRRRSWLAKILRPAAVLVVLAVLIGGITQIAGQSGPYDASVNRSFAAEGAVVAQESTATGSTVRHLMGTMQNLDRQTLEVDLDEVVAQAAQQESQGAELTGATSGGDLGGRFVAVLSDRAEAVSEVRSAVDGLLGLHPLAVDGAGAKGSDVVAAPTLLSSTAVADRIAAAGTLLARADRTYATVRHSLVRLAGHAQLPASRWITTTTTWAIGPVATEVDLLAASPTLAAVTNQLVLRAVLISPPALPSPTGTATAGVSTLSPTTKVVLSVVLSNLGSVDQPRATVQFTMAPQPAGAVMTLTRRAAIASGSSATLAPASFVVQPGHNYQLTVAVEGPPGETALAGSRLSETLQIAPST
jgi:hypothetical protein